MNITEERRAPGIMVATGNASMYSHTKCRSQNSLRQHVIRVLQAPSRISCQTIKDSSCRPERKAVQSDIFKCTQPFHQPMRMAWPGHQKAFDQASRQEKQASCSSDGCCCVPTVVMFSRHLHGIGAVATTMHNFSGRRWHTTVAHAANELACGNGHSSMGKRQCYVAQQKGVSAEP